MVHLDLGERGLLEFLDEVTLRQGLLDERSD